MGTPTDDLTARLQRSLKAALSVRDREGVNVLRAVLGAIQNAEAVQVESADAVDGSSLVPGAVDGVGAGEVPRRDLSVDDISAILRDELTERLAAGEQYRTLGYDDTAARMDREASLIAGLLPEFNKQQRSSRHRSTYS